MAWPPGVPPVPERAIDALPDPIIVHRIRRLRGHAVLLDSDLAELYAVETRVLNQAVRRNRDRFPEDFMFQLSPEEYRDLKSQNVISSWGGRRVPPFAFTEQGIAMLSSVLKSRRAIGVNIEIMRTFVRLRRIASGHADLAARLDELESKYDGQFQAVFEALRQLLSPLDRPAKRIGFRVQERKRQYRT